MIAMALLAALASAEIPSDREAQKAFQLLDADLKAVPRLEFQSASPLYLKFFGSADPKGILGFMDQRVQTISWDGEKPESVVAAAGNGKMSLCRGYSSGTPQILRMSALVHEARHSESERWKHVWCPSPYVFKLFGSSYRMPHFDDGLFRVCDDTELGAYGVQYAFLRAVVESCTHCTDKVKADAELFSDDTLSRISNPEAADRLFQGANLDDEKARKKADTVLRKIEAQFCVAGPFSSGYESFYKSPVFDSSESRDVYDGAVLQILGFEPVQHKSYQGAGVHVQVMSQRSFFRNVPDAAAAGEELWSYRSLLKCQ